MVRDAATAAKRGAAVAVDASQHALGALRRRVHGRGSGWAHLEEGPPDSVQGVPTGSGMRAEGI